MTAKTQDELIERELQNSFMQRSLELMREARAAGYVIHLNMHSDMNARWYQTHDSVVVAPNSGKKGPTLLYPEPSATGQRYVE